MGAKYRDETPYHGSRLSPLKLHHWLSETFTRPEGVRHLFGVCGVHGNHLWGFFTTQLFTFYFSHTCFNVELTFHTLV
jgi:hypothetical protein